jgi:glutamyl-tRNA reductase
MRILCTGISHKTAPVALRERLAISGDALPAALDNLSSRWAGCEFVVVSTCNRTEIYAARPLHGSPREHELHAWIAEYFSVDPRDFSHSLFTHSGASAARHLFEVASGLDSLVPGEGQIVSQVKEAHAAAVNAGCCRSVLGELFQTSLHVAKHARSETNIAAGKVSVASVAVQCLCDELGTLEGKTILAIGAGKINSLVLRRLAAEGKAHRILLANRSAQKAHALCIEGACIVEWADLPAAIMQSDAIISCTSSASPVITAKMLAQACAAPTRRLPVIDLAVPRDVEDSARDLAHVRLLNIDDLEAVVRRTLEGRRDFSTVQAIIDDHMKQYLASFRTRLAAPTIDALYDRMRRLASQELEAANARLSTHDDAAADAEIMQKAMHRMIGRILHPAVANLRKWSQGDGAEIYLEAVRKLFDLGPGEAPPKP